MNSKKLNYVSLAAMLSLGACVHVDSASVRPFFGNIWDSLDTAQTSSKDDPINCSATVSLNPAFHPVYSIKTIQANSSPDLPVHNFYDSRQERPINSLINYSLGLPQELTRQDTSFDTGLVQIAISDRESLTFRPKYSQAYDISFREDHLNVQEIKDYQAPAYSDFRFKNDILNDLPEDDPERVEHDQSAAIFSLARWMWGWKVFKPIKTVADQTRDYSNSAVRSVFGSHAEIDYNSGKLVFEYTGISTDYFNVDVNLWTELDDFKKSGLIVEMVLPFGRRR
ncbi:MAG: hypothetical protein AABX10_03365 [Nanoarchaeota archaeon]